MVAPNQEKKDDSGDELTVEERVEITQRLQARSLDQIANNLDLKFNTDNHQNEIRNRLLHGIDCRIGGLTNAVWWLTFTIGVLGIIAMFVFAQ